MLKIFHSDRFVPVLPEGHRFPISKYQLIREQLLYEGSITEEYLEEAEPCTEESILAVHTPAYWHAMKTLSFTPREERRMGFPQSAELVERSLRSCQGTLNAAIHALRYGAGMNIAGGTHHAYADRAEGFCLLNDLAISSRYLLRYESVKQILIVDLDVHQGNGTAHIFKDEPRVFTFSVHGRDNYPLHKEESDLDIPLPSGTEDVEYLKILRDHLEHLSSTVKPDFIFFQAGVDVLENDRLGKLGLSKSGCKQRDELVLEHCRMLEIPVAVCIGGGYGSRLADTVEAHANTFRTAIELYA